MSGVVRWSVKQVVFLLILAGALFISVGHFNWPMAWLYLGLVAASQALTALVLMLAAPALLVERSQLHEGTKRGDLLLAVLMGYSSVILSVAAGLDRRFGWSPLILSALPSGAAVIAALGSLLTIWAMASNRFFSGVVRIQTERGHTVVTTGPYRYVRHPGYVGALLFNLATPLILGSLWTLVPAGVLIGVAILRTALEDRFLQTELNGYGEYALRVRYRLVPGIW